MCGSIGINGNVVFRVWLLAGIFVSISLVVYAYDPYKLGQIDYFREKEIVDPKKEDPISFDWREPSIDVNGKASYYIPPGPMLTLLEHPTLENAQAYVIWQRQKMDKIAKAQKVVQQVLSEGRKP